MKLTIVANAMLLSAMAIAAYTVYNGFNTLPQYVH